MPLSTKQALYDLCSVYADQRKATAHQAILGAQGSANEETKSSSGDKYETGRAMAQLEIEKSTAQLAEATKLQSALSLIKLDGTSNHIQMGSLVITNQGKYFLAIGAGQLEHRGEIYYAISSESPMAKQLLGLTTGSVFEFNKRKFVVESVS